MKMNVTEYNSNRTDNQSDILTIGSEYFESISSNKECILSLNDSAINKILDQPNFTAMYKRNALVHIAD